MLKLFVFDIDGPLLEGLVVIDYVKFLNKQKLFDTQELKRILFEAKQYRAGKISYQKGATEVDDLFGEGLKGQSVKKIQHATQQFVRTLSKRIIRKNLQFLQLLQKRKTTKAVCLLSLEPQEWVDEIAKKLKIPKHHGYGAEFEKQNGYFTGKKWGQNAVTFKTQKLKTLMKKYRCKPRQTVFFGDQVTDWQSATKAKVHFVGLNPSRELVQKLKKQQKDWILT